MPSPDRSVPAAAAANRQRVSWGAVAAGVVIALATAIALNLLGAGIGIPVATFLASDLVSATPGVVGSWAWVGAGNLAGLAFGSYVAARLAGTVGRLDGALHGLSVWASYAVLAAVLLCDGLSVGGAAGARGVQGIVAAAGAIVSPALAVRAAPEAEHSFVQPIVRQALDSLRADIDPAGMATDARQAEIARLLTPLYFDGNRSLAGSGRLIRLVAAEQGISLPEAEVRVRAVRRQTEAALQDAEERAMLTAAEAARTTTVTAFAVAVMLLLGAVAAMLGARRGAR